MRQRKVKNVEEKIALHQESLIEKGMEMKGKWKEVFGNSGDIFLELGCGKGQFIVSQSMKNRELNFIGAEGQPTIILRAMEKAAVHELANLKFITGFVRDIKDYFEEGELSGVYLNFSDPWPKERHDKRRLTYRSYLEGYRWVVRPGGFLEFKTDNEGLFDFTLEQIGEMNLEVVETTRDLHHSNIPAKNITTEYEDKFVAAGKSIHYVKVKLK